MAHHPGKIRYYLQNLSLLSKKGDRPGMGITVEAVGRSPMGHWPPRLGANIDKEDLFEIPDAWM